MTKRNPRLNGYQKMEALVQMQKANEVCSLQTWSKIFLTLLFLLLPLLLSLALSKIRL